MRTLRAILVLTLTLVTIPPAHGQVERSREGGAVLSDAAADSLRHPDPRQAADVQVEEADGLEGYIDRDGDGIDDRLTSTGRRRRRSLDLVPPEEDPAGASATSDPCGQCVLPPGP
jgi:hypothetical protein